MEVHQSQNDIQRDLERRRNVQIVQNTYYNELETIMTILMRIEQHTHSGCPLGVVHLVINRLSNNLLNSK